MEISKLDQVNEETRRIASETEIWMGPNRDCWIPVMITFLDLVPEIDH